MDLFKSGGLILMSGWLDGKVVRRGKELGLKLDYCTANSH
jgi:hypothetical protein